MAIPMAAALASNTRNDTLTSDSQNFGNNLFADLAPLLVLFGDETTKQFLSTSMGWSDNIVLAIAPLGIMTTIVSAIRIAGGNFLKSFIGRARESSDDEEKEILSSTSSNVREIWDGARVVRQSGESKTIELVCVKSETAPRLCSLSEALVSDKDEHYDIHKKWIYQITDGYTPNTHSTSNGTESQNANNSGIENGGDDVTARLALADHLETKAPNLTLNIPQALPTPITIWIFALLGVVIQTTVLAVSGLVTYYWKWPRGGHVVAPYGYPVWAAGTVCLTVGMCFCARVVEASTREFIVGPAAHATQDILQAEIVRFQKRMPNLNLPGYAIYTGGAQNHLVRISRRIWPPKQHRDGSSTCLGDTKLKALGRKLQLLTSIGSFLTLSGFVCQNIGTRELHWSIGILQLGATLILATCRALLRRHVGDKVQNAIPLRAGYEASHLACHIQKCTHWKSITSPHYLDDQPPRDDVLHLFMFHADREQTYKRMASRVHQNQIRLSNFEPDPDEMSTICSSLFAAIGEILALVELRELYWDQYIEVAGENLPLLNSGTDEGLPRSVIAALVSAETIEVGAPKVPGKVFWPKRIQAILSLTINHHLSEFEKYHRLGNGNRPISRFTHTVATVKTDQLEPKKEALSLWIGRNRILTLSRSSDGQTSSFEHPYTVQDQDTVLDLNSGSFDKRNLHQTPHLGLRPGMTRFFALSSRTDGENLWQAIALEFIATFMSSLVSSSETAKAKIQSCLEASTTHVQQNSDPRSWAWGLDRGDYVYSNSFVDSILEILVKHELGGLADATVAVVPAFLVHGYTIPGPDVGKLDRANEHRGEVQRIEAQRREREAAFNEMSSRRTSSHPESLEDADTEV